MKKILLVLLTALVFVSLSACKPKTVEAEEVVLSDKEISLTISGQTYLINAIVLPANTTDKTLKYESADPTICTVGEKGLITAVSSGDTVIRVSCGNATSELKVHVSITVNAESIITDKTNVTLTEAGETYQINAAVKPDNTTDKTLKYESMNPAVCTVSDTGVVTAVADGDTTIRVTCGDASTGVNVHVRIVVYPESVTLEKDKIELTSKGQSYQIKATVSPENTTDKTLEYKSANTKVCTVSVTGVVKAVGDGDTTVTVSCGDVSTTLQVHVSIIVKPENVFVKNSEIVITEVGETYEINATVSPDNTTDKTLKYESADTKVCTVSDKGIITAVGDGETTVKVSCGDVSTEITVHVSITVKAEKITLDKDVISFAEIGKTHQIKATVYPENTTDKTLKFVSSDTSVCTVNGNGQVKAIGVGDAVVTVSCGDVSAELHVHVLMRMVTATYYNVLPEEVCSEEYYPTLTLYSDNTFSYVENNYGGLITLNGAFTKSGSTYTMTVKEQLVGGKSTDIDYPKITLQVLNSDYLLLQTQMSMSEYYDVLSKSKSRTLFETYYINDDVVSDDYRTNLQLYTDRTFVLEENFLEGFEIVEGSYDTEYPLQLTLQATKTTNRTGFNYQGIQLKKVSKGLQLLSDLYYNKKGAIFTDVKRALK